MNIIEYALRFKDMASGELIKFGAAARNTLNQTQQYTGRLMQQNNTLARSYDTIQSRIRQIEAQIKSSTSVSQIRSLRRELQHLQNDANKSMANIALGGGGKGFLGSLAGRMGFGGAPQMLAAGALVGGVTALGSFGSDAISAAMERQKTQTSFNVLTGSEQAGSALTKQLVDLQKNTILGPEVFKNAQTLMGFGVQAGEVTKYLKTLGDIAMGDKEKFGALSLAFAQSSAAGKLMGQDLLQMINAGFNPLQEISKRTGKSIGRLKDEMAKGNITSEMVKQAFIDATSEGGRFNNMLATIAETPAGKMQQFNAKWNEFKVQAGEALMPLTSGFLELANMAMPIIERLIKPIGNGIQRAVGFVKELFAGTGTWSDYLTIAKDLFTDHILPVISKIWGFIKSTVGKLIEFIGQSELFKDIFRAVKDFVGMIWDFVGGLIDALKWLFDKVVMPMLNVIELTWRLVKGKNDGTAVKVGFASQISAKQEKQADTNNKLLTDIKTNTAENNSAVSNNNKAVTSGGPKIINITVPKFLDNINITTNNLRESASEIGDQFLEMFGRVVVQGGYAQ